MRAKTKDWKRELDDLVDKTGKSLKDVCAYIDVKYRGYVGFYYKIPRKRKMLIGIGMAFRQDLGTINEWIMKYGDKKKLYSKDVLEDLVWIYLINSNYEDPDEKYNYFMLYDDCHDIIQKTYVELWNEYTYGGKETVDIDKELDCVGFDESFEGLRSFVVENMDSFRSAYSKPRKMLTSYVDAILDTFTRANGGDETPVNFLRGYLDDSMINYIVGGYEDINVIDMKSRDRSTNTKAVPKLKKTHIAICLALGMCADEIDRYLELMGYGSLDMEDSTEAALKEHLDKWEAAHSKTKAFKRKYIPGFSSASGRMPAKKTSLSMKEELQAVSDMLMLRTDMSYEFRKVGTAFPYMKE